MSIPLLLNLISLFFLSGENTCFKDDQMLGQILSSVQFISVAQSCPTLCDPMDCSTPGPLSITSSRNLPKLMSIESVMPSKHLTLCRPLLLLLSILPSNRVFSNESVLPISSVQFTQSCLESSYLVF